MRLVFEAVIIYNVCFVTLNSMIYPYYGVAVCISIFMPKTWLGGHLGGRLGGHFHGLQKRNVLIRWTLRWTLLTLLKCDF